MVREPFYARFFGLDVNQGNNFQGARGSDLRRRIGDRVREKGQVFIANPRAADLPFEPEKTLHVRQGTLS